MQLFSFLFVVAVLVDFLTALLDPMVRRHQTQT
jgi:ABC-type dipeptide/oligopeptide/nickel transport system permease component